MNIEQSFEELKRIISKEVETVKEISSFSTGKKYDQEDKKITSLHIGALIKSLRKENEKIPKVLENIYLKRSFSNDKKINVEETQKPNIEKKKPRKNVIVEFFNKRKNLKKLSVEKREINTLKRLRKIDKKVIEKKSRKPNKYVSISNKIFARSSGYLIEKGMFKGLGKDLLKANMDFLPKNYISVVFFTTILSFIAGIFIFLIFLFFNLKAGFPFFALSLEPLTGRVVKVFWILFVIPIGTLLLMYFYPSLEKTALENRINQELPFATINMAAVSGSLADPTKIFSILTLTKEYPNLEKEFIKIINGVNVLGYDLITVLRNSGQNNPSKKLSDLLNGIATTINSGGDLPKFFDERAKTLLFEYNLEKEKSTRAAETFMDIYISVVIAAPMILMLLLIMMQVSGIGIALSTSAITLIIISGVSVINLLFFAFLHIKQSGEAY